MFMLNISVCKGILYIGSQIVGAIIGSAFVLALIPEELGTSSLTSSFRPFGY
jgi:glycerol uptake facilitator-like aquaporin